MDRTDSPGSPPHQSSPCDVLDRVTDPVYALGEEWRFTFLNERAEELFERPEEELVGEIIWDIYPAMAASTFQLELERAVETQESVTFEAYYPWEDAWFEVSAYPSETDLSVYSRDVTDRGNLHQELEEREQALRRAYQVIVDPDRTFSQKIESLLEVVRTAIGTDYATLSRVDESTDEYLFEHVLVPDQVALEAGDTTRASSLPNCSHVVETAETLVLQDVEKEAPELADPEWGISCYLGAPVVVNGDVYGTFCFYGMESRTEQFSDWEVTFVDLLSNWVGNELERQTYERQLEVSNERLERFAHAASHDLQEPLRMMSSYLQLIESRYGETLDEEGREFLEFAVDGADRMREMVQSLLEYSRIESQGDPLEPVDLDDVLTDVRQDLEMKIAESDAEITVRNLPRVEGDADQLGQLFQNLLKNAIEYSGEESPRVEITAERDGDMWNISVQDEGVGIDPADQDQIFEVFERLNSRQNDEGTGVGLALCERIVERHGGDIRVESEPGVGSTFTFSLPETDDPDS